MTIDYSRRQGISIVNWPYDRRQKMIDSKADTAVPAISITGREEKKDDAKRPGKDDKRVLFPGAAVASCPESGN